VGSGERMALPKVVLVTGLSGAGKTLAARALEDMGYYCVDNLPADLVVPFVDLGAQAGRTRLAIVNDVRDSRTFTALTAALDQLVARGVPVHVLFLEALDEVLVRRYKESRRRHPLSDGGSILEGIRRERELLSELRGRASRVVDTTSLTPNDLRRELASLFGSEAGGGGLLVTVTSFGFKHGLPLDADLVFDVRFLPNPHYVPELAPLAGTDPRVLRYVLESQQGLGKDLVARLQELLAFLLPRYAEEGKEQLMVAVGCTGGQHRSVAVAEVLARFLRRSGYAAAVVHRDLVRALGGAGRHGENHGTA
jgi:UPF0042 nucleotide-binding protein